LNTPPSNASAHGALTSSPVRAVACMVALTAVTQYIPGLARWRLLGQTPDSATAVLPRVAEQKAIVGESALTEESRGDSSNSRPEATRPASAAGVIAATQGAAVPAESVDSKPPPVHLEDSQDRGLAHFYRALRRTSHTEAAATTRVVHFGYFASIATEAIWRCRTRLLIDRQCMAFVLS